MKAPWQHSFSFIRQYPAFGLLVSAIIGFLLYYWNIRLPLGWVIALIIVGLFIVILSFKYAPKPLISALLLLCISLCSWALMYQSDIKNRKDWFGHHLSNNQATIAVIAAPAANKKKTQKLIVNIIGKVEKGYFTPQSGKAIVYIYLPVLQNYNTGDTVLISSAWQEVNAPKNPYSFNYKAYLATQNIYHLQYTAASQVSVLGNATSVNIFVAMHLWCVEQLERYLPNLKVRGVMQAMLVGEEAHLDPELRDAYAQAGIIHIIAISGGHIVFLFGMIAFLFRRWKSRLGQITKYALGLSIIWMYVWIAGSPPSAIRAATMFSIVAASFFLARRSQTINSIFLSAFVLLCWQPMWVLSVGFQLSVLAVLSLAFFYPKISTWWQPKWSVLKGIRNLLAASLAVEILVAPLVIYYFNLFPISFLLSNLVAWALMGGAMILGVGLLLFSFWPWLAGVFGQCIGFLLELVNGVVFALNQLHPQWSQRLYLSLAGLLVTYLTIVLFTIEMKRKKHLFIQLGIVTMSLIIVASAVNFYIKSRQEILVVYDIPKQLLVEHIRFRKAKAYADKSDSLQYAYAVKPAHIFWQVKERITMPARNHAFFVQHKKIWLLTNPHFHDSILADCDILIMGVRPKGLNFRKVLQTFKPELMVLSSAFSKGYNRIWQDSCKANGIQYHSVADEGAFVLSGK